MADDEQNCRLKAERQLRNSVKPSMCDMCRQSTTDVDSVVIAAHANCIPCLKILQFKGVTLSILFPSRESALHCATDPAVLCFLHEQGVTLEHRNTMDRTPLIAAVDKGDSCKVEVLLDLGASAAVESFGHGLLNRCAWQPDRRLPQLRGGGGSYPQKH